LVLTPNRTGKYRLRDSQFSGTYFALMEADVYVESPTAYSHWLEQATQQQKKTAVNPAFSAGAQSEKTLLNSGWRTGSFKNYT
jgi:cytochrome c oxidase subunit 2